MTSRQRLLAACLICIPALCLPVHADQPLAVATVTAWPEAETRIMSLVGDIAARETLSVSFPASGRVTSVAVDEGDRVGAGAVLAQMEDVQQTQALLAAEAGVTTAQADFDQAREDLRRQTALLERGATTRIARDTAEDKLAIASGTLARATAELDRARTALEDTVLRAPSDVTVIRRMIEPGQVIGAAQSVLDLAVGDAFDALFEVPEALLAYADGSEDVTLSLLGNSVAEFSGRVRQVSPLVDPSTGTVEVKVAIIDPPDQLTYGDPVRGMVRGQSGSKIVLPFPAMSTTQAGPAVWVVDEATNVVSLQQVEVDRFETGRIILNGGIEPGTRVVTHGAHLLYPGRVVRMLEDTQ